MTDHAANFAIPHERLAWARHAIAEFHLESMKFLGSRRDSRVVQQDFSIRTETVKIVFEDAIPSVVQNLANRAIEDIKNVFDQAIFAACKTINTDFNGENIHFPWTDSAVGFETRLTSQRNKIPEALHSVMCRLRPYGVPDDDAHGDSITRKLATIANRKHTVGLHVTPDIARVKSPTFIGGENLDWGSGVPVDFPPPRWDPDNNEVILATGPLGLHECLAKDTQITFFLAIDEPGLIGQLPFYNIIRMFAGKAQEVVETLEAEAARLAN